jgi:uncharacterized protein
MRIAMLFFLVLAGTCSAQTDYSGFREHYKQEFLTDPRSPLTAADTAMLDFYPPDSAWALRARFEATPDSKAFGMLTYSGQEKPYRQFGWLYFEKDGQAFRLAVYQNLKLIANDAYKDHLFLPFKDVSNGEETYGGGRYMDLSRLDIFDGSTITIDFNKCYNPWCAYSDGYSCPIPPVENHLEIAVPAGEKNFRGAHKH